MALDEEWLLEDTVGGGGGRGVSKFLESNGKTVSCITSFKKYKMPCNKPNQGNKGILQRMFLNN